MILYHNNRCSKSREALAFLETRGICPQLVHYLDTPPDEAQLRDLAAKLGLTSPHGMMRIKDELYRELNLADADDDALFAALAAHPKLLERPIAVLGNRAAIGRPLENIARLLEQAA